MPAKRDLDPGPRRCTSSAPRCGGREVARMALADLGAVVPCDASTVSKIEAASSALNVRFVSACVETFPPLEWLSRFYEDSQMWGDGSIPRSFQDSAESRARGDDDADLAAPPHPRPAPDRRLRPGAVSADC